MQHLRLPLQGFGFPGCIENQEWRGFVLAKRAGEARARQNRHRRRHLENVSCRSRGRLPVQ